LDRTTVLALFAMSMSVLVIANDFSAVNVALPTMEEDFSTNVNTIQWVINAYALTFGVLIVTGGRLADMFGRRRAFFVGTAIFASMSALGGAAPTEAWLIASRVAMGIGGALMWPAILGMTFALLPAEKAGLAGGIILGAAGLGNALGPLIGGVLTDALSWRWIFFLNVPISAFAVLVTYYLVRIEEPEVEKQRIDYPGIATLSIGLVSLLIALDQVNDWGWGDPKTIALLALSALLVTAFVPIERRTGMSALVPRAVMRNESFRASCIAITFMSATFFASLLYLPQFMQKHLEYSPLEAGVGVLPFLGTFALVSFVAGPLYNRVGAKSLAALGAACIAIAPFLFSQVTESSGYGSLVIGMIVLGVGIGSFYPTATTAGVTSVDESQSSLAGGILYMCQIAGGSIGLGLTTAVFSSQTPPFVDGIQAAFRLDAALSLVGFLIALFFVGGRLLRRRGPAEAAP
jgi:EmrB/QacA subfamily drug resistance transporter